MGGKGTQVIRICISYSATVSRSAVFADVADFADGSSTVKIVLCIIYRQDRPIKTNNITIHKHVIALLEPSCDFVCNRSGTMFLLRYFSTVCTNQKLTDPQGALARDILSSTITTSDAEMKHMQSE